MTFSKLGTDTETGQIVELPQASRRQGLYIIGATGTGKSGLITNLVLQDIKQGKGVAVLDPHTDLTISILARLPSDREKDVILLDALDKTHVFGLNLYQCDDTTDDELVQETYERVAHIFEVLWLEENEAKFGVRVAQGIRNSTYTLIGNSSIYGCGMLEIPLLFEEDVPRTNMLVKLPPSIKQIVEKYWKRHEGFDKGEKADRADMVANKVEDYIDNPIFRRIVGQSRTTINVRDIMETGKILLVKLPGKFEKMTEILGAMIIAQILAASYAREAQQKRRQFNIYADEFQRFATRDFAKLLTEASRKYNTPVTIAHQARDFLDLKNQAASLQVANLIVLRILYKDAQEVAGSFNIRPEEAWEEELEEEQLEIREQERLEMMEVIDGEEELEAPATDVVGQLLKGGSHPNPVVNRFTHDVLHQLTLDSDRNSPAKAILALLNKLFYDAMTGNPTPMPPIDFFLYIASLLGFRAYIRCIAEPPDYLQRPEFGLSKTWIKIFALGVTRVWDYQTARQALEAIWHDGYNATQAIAFFDQEMRQTLREGLLSYLKHELDEIGIAWDFYGRGVWQDYQEWGAAIITNHRNYAKTPQEWLPWYKQHSWKPKHPDETWYHIDFAQLEWEEFPYEPWGDPNQLTTFEWRSGFGLKEIPSAYANWLKIHNEWLAIGFRLEFRLKEGQEDKFYREEDLEDAIETQYQGEKENFLGFIQELKDVMQALADEPIYAGSGIRQPRKRQQILLHPEKTFPHPRVAIVHPQRTYQDVLNEVANQLSNMPNYVARVRITDEQEQLVEHTIKTLKPEQGLGEDKLAKRVARIKQHMVDVGYYRAKTEVDAEITKRHELLRQNGHQPPRKTSRNVTI